MLEKETGLVDDSFRLIQVDCQPLSEGEVKESGMIHPEYAKEDTGLLQRSYDIVVSNACLQWLPDHDTTFRKVSQMVGKEGK